MDGRDGLDNLQVFPTPLSQAAPVQAHPGTRTIWLVTTVLPAKVPRPGKDTLAGERSVSCASTTIEGQNRVSPLSPSQLHSCRHSSSNKPFSCRSGCHFELRLAVHSVKLRQTTQSPFQDYFDSSINHIITDGCMMFAIKFVQLCK